MPPVEGASTAAVCPYSADPPKYESWLEAGAVETQSACSRIMEILSGLDLGALTEEGMFLLMSDLISMQGREVQTKAMQIRIQTDIQKKYAELRTLWNHAQSCAGDGKALTTDELTGLLESLNYSPAEIPDIIAELDAGEEGVFGLAELEDFFNRRIFGDETAFYVKMAKGTFEMNSFQSAVLDKIEAKQQEMGSDTSLLMTELQQATQQLQRYQQMLTQLINRFHETEMAIIRNI